MTVPHDTLLLSLRFAIPHQPLIVRRVSCFHFGSRYPTSVVVCDVATVFISLLDTPPAHQPGGQNSDQQDRILLARPGESRLVEFSCSGSCRSSRDAVPNVIFRTEVGSLIAI